MTEDPWAVFDEAVVASQRAPTAPRPSLQLALYARCSTEDLQSPKTPSSGKPGRPPR